MKQYAKYKGRTYLLDWSGKTKHGPRAKLSFRDGSKSFWVDASLVSETSAPQSGQPCAECHRGRGTIMCEDSSGIMAPCCPRCASLDWLERSYG